ncbi:MAG: PVC-type heme-binding CxxCH protein [Ferruginibacter sp.]
MILYKLTVKITLIIALFISGCRFNGDENKKHNPALPENIAGNEAVAKYMKSFEGRGALSDNSVLTPPEKAIAAFRYPADLQLKLVLSEPEMSQPVNINFDARGRLWVVQYNQYPYPKGLKVIKIDEYNRVRFDKIPDPPPNGMKGADKITFFEDTDNDGKYDKAVDAITGLNIATSVAFGRGKIWVLNPPYLLAYPDPDNDGIPDGSPVVHLDGFGIEDTHAVANSLRWGPDGWLYGAQGSTVTAKINSSVTKNVSFSGQAIWRYHPGTHVFEIFAEGGGNTFNVEIDAKGRIYSGDNGTDRGQYYKQGCYYVKRIEKHGAYTNPFAFGHLANMALTGDRIRFTHAFIKYEGANLPDRYNGQMIAINPLQNYVQLTRFEPDGSTFGTVDEERILETNDKWFRPVDIKAGPDGAVYLADWSDSRLSHIDPRDTWDKNSGRIYSLKSKKDEVILPPFDLNKFSNDQLIKLLEHTNKWFRQQALQIIGDRKDPALVPLLLPLLLAENSQTALEALWAINLSGGFNDKIAITALHHKDAFVRMWAVRLVGDSNEASKIISSELIRLASVELHPEVRSQLIATAKRLPGSISMEIIKRLLSRNIDADDPDIPLQIWWAIESKSELNQQEVLHMFENPSMWNNKIVLNIILQRLMERYFIAGGSANLNACARLLNLAPKLKLGKPLIDGLQKALEGRDTIKFPPAMSEALERYKGEYSEELTGIALRQGDAIAIQKALKIIGNNSSSSKEKLSYIRILGELNIPKAVPVLLNLMDQQQVPGNILQEALSALQRYDDPEIGSRVLNAYPGKLKHDPDVRMAAISLFTTRINRANQLLDTIIRRKLINKEEIPEEIIMQLRSLNNTGITQKVNRIWPGDHDVASADKNKVIDRITLLLKSAKGNPSKGKTIFITTCGNCHKLFDTGASLGPDLTGYDRSNLQDLLTNIVDPNAYIREGFVNYTVKTTDGRTLAGFLKAHTSVSTTIQPSTGNPISISNNQIRELNAQQTSFMPERLIEKLRDDQVLDIFSYIMQDKKK